MTSNAPMTMNMNATNVVNPQAGDMTMGSVQIVGRMMSDNYRKDISEYSQWCMPSVKQGKEVHVYRPNSMRKVNACKELNRLMVRIDELESQLLKETNKNRSLLDPSGLLLPPLADPNEQ